MHIVKFRVVLMLLINVCRIEMFLTYVMILWRFWHAYTDIVQNWLYQSHYVYL